MSPHPEVALQFPLLPTKHGSDAVGLMGEAMAEAYRSWDKAMPKLRSYIRLRNNLTRRFFTGFQRQPPPLVSIHADNVDESLVKTNRLFPATTTSAGQNTVLTGESDESVNYCEVFARLPAGFRSAMILSYIEGFLNREIADLAGVQLHTVESLLNRGRGLLQKRILTHPMGDDGLNTILESGVEA